MQNVHISRRGSVNISNGTTSLTPTTAASLPSRVAEQFTVSSGSSSQLNASRTKLAELQRKSRSLSASLRRHEHLMTNLASDTAAVEAQAQRQVDRRLGSPAFSKYGSSKSVVGTSSYIHTHTAALASALASASTSASLSTPTTSSATASPSRIERVDAAYIEGFERQKESMKREMTVALARDLSEAKANNEDLQHSCAMKDVQLRVCEAEVERLRDGERKYMEKMSSLSRSVSELKSHLDRQQDVSNKFERSNRASELEAERTLQQLSETRQLFTTEKIEREALARQVITLNDERNALHRELTALRESEQIVLDEVRRERTNFYQTQQVTRTELEELQNELRVTTREASEFRASALSYRVRSEESENALMNVQQVHKATIEQLVNTRERLKREQDARWNAESEAARLRGSLG